MPHLLLTLLTGLTAGSAHVLSGPDHLAAIAPLAVDQRRKTWRVGLSWGVGHSTGVWVLAILALFFREALPIDLLSSWGERLVGFVLIGLGLWGLRRLLRTHVHSHVHEHDGVRHAHVHVHDDRPGEDHPLAHSHSHSALGIGTLHGLAGTSHLLGVLPALLLPTRSAAAAYVFSFGIGSIVSMTAFAWGVGRLAHLLHGIGDRGYRLLLGGCSVGSILIGFYWCWMTLAASVPPV